MVTSDPSVLAYAAGRSNLTVAPLAWNRTYVLLSTSRASSLQKGAAVQRVTPDLAVGLARDAVRVDARPCSPPEWWLEPDDCPELSAALGNTAAASESVIDRVLPSSRRVLYDTNDPTAKDLAERIVALAAEDPTASVQTEAVYTALPGLTRDPGSMLITADVPSDEFERSLRGGEDFAYILSLPRMAPDACTEFRKLISQAPWLRTLGSDARRAFVLLIDTRPHLIVKGGGFRLGTDWYGNVFVLSPGQPRQPE
jgi:hypothetical protein